MAADEPIEIRVEAVELDAEQHFRDDESDPGPKFRCRMHVIFRDGRVISDPTEGRWTHAFSGLVDYDEAVVREYLSEDFLDTTDDDRWWPVMAELHRSGVDITAEDLDELPLNMEVRLIESDVGRPRRAQRAHEARGIAESESRWLTLVEALRALEGRDVRVGVRAMPPSEPMWFLDTYAQLRRVYSAEQVIQLQLGDHTTATLQARDLAFVEIDGSTVSVGLGALLVMIEVA
ncbi:MAG TPA: hypothetical protein VNT03_12435 [Baekduia sp.]|nr:hypothetical protein [Baekduia sp.]